MGNHASLFSSKSFPKTDITSSYNAGGQKKPVNENQASMTMSCVFSEEISNAKKKPHANVLRRLLHSKKLFRRPVSSSSLVEVPEQLPVSMAKRKTIIATTEAAEYAVPDFDAIFEHAAQRNDEILRVIPEITKSKITAVTTVSSENEMNFAEELKMPNSILSEGGSSRDRVSENDSQPSCSRSGPDASAWRRAMSLRVTFLHDQSLENENACVYASSEEDLQRKSSTASTSSRKEKLSRTTSSRCLGQTELPMPIRRWLSSADFVCDQELIDLVNEIMPQDEWFELRRNSAKRGNRKADYQPLLSPAQIKLIRNHWNGLYITIGPTAIGNHLFNRIAFKNPQSKKILLSLLVDHLSPGYFSKRHARLIGIILNFVIKNLELPENISVLLKMVGHCHAQLWKVGLSPGIWNVFAEALLECSLEWGEKSRRVDENRKAWAIIIAFVTEKLKAGFNEARKEFQTNLQP